MSLNEIQRAVDTLTQDERVKLTAWMVARYPMLKVADLMSTASELVENGRWSPGPPTDENRPTGKMLNRALRIAEEHGLDK